MQKFVYDAHSSTALINVRIRSERKWKSIK